MSGISDEVVHGISPQSALPLGLELSSTELVAVSNVNGFLYADMEFEWHKNQS